MSHVIQRPPLPACERVRKTQRISPQCCMQALGESDHSLHKQDTSCRGTPTTVFCSCSCCRKHLNCFVSIALRQSNRRHILYCVMTYSLLCYARKHRGLATSIWVLWGISICRHWVGTWNVENTLHNLLNDTYKHLTVLSNSNHPIPTNRRNSYPTRVCLLKVDQLLQCVATHEDELESMKQWIPTCAKQSVNHISWPEIYGD